MDTALVFLLLVAIPALCYGQSDRYLHTYPPYNETDPRTPLTVALLQSFGGSFNSSGGVAGVQVALDLINNNLDLLPGYSLHYTLTDTQVKRPISFQATVGSYLLLLFKPALWAGASSITIFLSNFFIKSLANKRIFRPLSS